MKVLLVEDEALVGLDLADTLQELGHEVLGPLLTVGRAMPFCRAEHADFAILDFNLGRETSEPLADALAGEGVPFVFLTGYRPDALPARFRDRPILQKPLHPAILARVIDEIRSEAF
ncbi:response regulator [Roseibacterium sp. SDUM158017]|uniref:response regulator n=1 Tax=Roseicyclus salinarum TaxID=3036773 RepID=UPI0024150106|nr:response regulator [Roseibacterium sp. SDUM158017]MDG4650202.1 response regulator [Roseibacterium sp. SDUM158017]